MSGLIEGLRTGAWVTRERMRFVALAVLAAFTIGFGYVIATAHDGVDFQGRPIGTDFSNVYAAGSYALDGNPDAAFDPALQHAREQAIFGNDTPAYGWHYPPFFLFIATALALMPYGLALAVWQGVTLLLYLVSTRAILRAFAPRSRNGGQLVSDPLWLVLAIGFPAVFVNFGHGHNGFLTAALLGTALVLLRDRPVLAGVLFGLLAYKPQFGVMIPLVLVASGRWRAVAAAAATVVVLALATTLTCGPHVWEAFLASTRFTRVVVLEAGDTGWHKIQSVFSWTRMWGGSIALAYAMQGAVTAALGGALVWLWRSAASFPLKAAALCIAAILATPYSLDYDMTVLAPAIAFVAADGLAHGFRAWEKSALAGLWLVPMVTRSFAEWTLIPLGVPMMIAMFLVVLRRAAANDRLMSTPVGFRPSGRKTKPPAQDRPAEHGRARTAFFVTAK